MVNEKIPSSSLGNDETRKEQINSVLKYLRWTGIVPCKRFYQLHLEVLYIIHPVQRMHFLNNHLLLSPNGVNSYEPQIITEGIIRSTEL